MNIIIAGNRNFYDYQKLSKNVDDILKALGISKNKVTIFSGGAKGTDRMGEEYARNNNLKVRIFEAHWDTLGRAAGPVRNTEMIDRADMLIAFWDGNSKGTSDIIAKAKIKGIHNYVINI